MTKPTGDMFKFEELQVYFRDSFVPFAQANISIANAGFLYGLAVFTGMRAHVNAATGKVYLFRPDAHYARFRFGCTLFQYKSFLENYDYPKFLGVLKKLITVNNLREDTYIRVCNFSDENRVTPKFLYKDSLCAYLYPLGDYVPTSGMKCKVSSWTRFEDNAIPARAKTNGGYVNSAFAKTEALQNGFDEAVFLNSRGHVIEGSAQNFFMVSGGKLITPPVSDNILEGITRDSVMTMARDSGIEVVERNISRTEIYRAEEVFLTGSGAKVSPVVQLDHYPVGDGQVGPISKKLQDLYFRAVKGEVAQYRHWLVDAYEN